MRVAEGFVTTTLICCVGAMAILGAMDSGLRHNHDVLYTKAMLDGFSAVIFASTLGIGVLFSSVLVFLYQGSIALASTWIASLISQLLSKSCSGRPGSRCKRRSGQPGKRLGVFSKNT